jgi:isoquinoline 1-oxidoreductase beta subunit
MEPMTCTAHVRPDGVTVWSPTQNQTYSRQVAAELAGVPVDSVEVFTTFLGSGFGRKFELDVLAEAVLLSAEVGKPVKVIRRREDDIGQDFYRPGCAQRVTASLDANGMVASWSHKTAISSIMTRVFPDYVVNGVDPSSVEGITDTPYQFPGQRVVLVTTDLPVPVGFWRSVGNSQNAFVMESFMDELAHAARRDPLEFRLAHLPPDSPARAVLQKAAAAAGWGTPRPSDRHLGIAQHHSFGSWFAHVAEVSVSATGRVRVHRIWTAVDCGTVVHPDTVVAQAEGATIMGVSMALVERMELAGGGAGSENFHDYEILRMDEAPQIQVVLAPSGGFVGGIGEPGLPPTAPAIANAVFAATGARVRTLPLTPATVLAAIQEVKG